MSRGLKGRLSPYSSSNLNVRSSSALRHIELEKFRFQFANLVARLGQRIENVFALGFELLDEQIFAPLPVPITF